MMLWLIFSAQTCFSTSNFGLKNAEKKVLEFGYYSCVPLLVMSEDFKKSQQELITHFSIVNSDMELNLNIPVSPSLKWSQKEVSDFEELVTKNKQFNTTKLLEILCDHFKDKPYGAVRSRLLQGQKKAQEVSIKTSKKKKPL